MANNSVSCLKSHHFDSSNVEVLPEKPIKRKSVSQEYMAEFVGRGEPITESQHYCFYECLHDNICNMVYKIAHKYKKSIKNEDLYDLSQCCWEQIIKKLDQFDSNKAKFTTWCWWVCTSTLNKYYWSHKKYSEHFVDSLEGFDDNRIENENVSSTVKIKEINKIIHELRETYPEKSHIIDAMFRETINKKTIQTDICFNQVARDCGENACVVSRFFHRTIKPFFLEKFK